MYRNESAVGSGSTGTSTSGAVLNKTACGHPTASIPAEDLQFSIDEQKMCHREVWTQEQELLITTDPRLTLT